MASNMEYCGTRYEGQWKDGKFDGHGTYFFPDGTRYAGQFKQGLFHGDGVIHIATGSYRVRFDMGKEAEGEFSFTDGLVYKDKDWSYCTPEDRRFFTEIEAGEAEGDSSGGGIRPAGAMRQSNLGHDPPAGCYDVGDGYYNPETRTVMAWEGGAVLRKPDFKEREFIAAKCRRALTDSEKVAPPASARAGGSAGAAR